MAVGQLPHTRYAFVDGMVELEVLTLQNRCGAAPGSRARRRRTRMSSFGPSPTRRALPAMPQASSIRAEVAGQWVSSSMASYNNARMRSNAGARSCPADHSGHAVALIKNKSPGRASGLACHDHGVGSPGGGNPDRILAWCQTGKRRACERALIVHVADIALGVGYQRSATGRRAGRAHTHPRGCTRHDRQDRLRHAGAIGDDTWFERGGQTHVAVRQCDDDVFADYGDEITNEVGA